jgi:hypothetical protein
MTEEQRLAIIANAHCESKGLTTSSAVMELVGDLQAEAFVVENGLAEVRDYDNFFIRTKPKRLMKKKKISE